MISLDTNILLPAVEIRNPNHPRAAAFLESLQDRQDVAIGEFILLELYVLLRNPAVLAKPLSPAAATDVCQAFRQHPRWQVIGFPPDSRDFHDIFWPKLREDFLIPLGLSEYRVAKDIGVPPRRINEIVKGKRSLTVDTALRLERYFGWPADVWLNLQSHHDQQTAKISLKSALAEIHPCPAL